MLKQMTFLTLLLAGQAFGQTAISTLNSATTTQGHSEALGALSADKVFDILRGPGMKTCRISLVPEGRCKLFFSAMKGTQQLGKCIQYRSSIAPFSLAATADTAIIQSQARLAQSISFSASNTDYKQQAKQFLSQLQTTEGICKPDYQTKILRTDLGALDISKVNVYLDKNKKYVCVTDQMSASFRDPSTCQMTKLPRKMSEDACKRILRKMAVNRDISGIKPDGSNSLTFAALPDALAAQIELSDAIAVPSVLPQIMDASLNLPVHAFLSEKLNAALLTADLSTNAGITSFLTANPDEGHAMLIEYHQAYLNLKDNQRVVKTADMATVANVIANHTDIKPHLTAVSANLQAMPNFATLDLAYTAQVVSALPAVVKPKFIKANFYGCPVAMEMKATSSL